MIRIKNGVAPRNLIICAAAANTAAAMSVDVTITSGMDGEHMVGSKHYIGEALDIRLLGARTNEFRVLIAKRLGADYQVILENDHIHIEYSPK